MKRPGSIRVFGSIAGLLICAFLIGGGWVTIKQFSRADDSVPREVIVSPITTNNATISWSTGVTTQGVVEYGTSPTNLTFYAPETESSLQHEVQLTLLSPNTTYYFQIRVGDSKYDNGGVPWTFTTKLTDDKTSTTSTATSSPTPIQHLSIPSTKITTVPAVCTDTDCEKIKAKFGQGCSTQDYIRCLKRK